MSEELQRKGRPGVIEADRDMIQPDEAGAPIVVGMAAYLATSFEGGAGGPGDEDLAMAAQEKWETEQGIDSVVHEEDLDIY